MMNHNQTADIESDDWEDEEPFPEPEPVELPIDGVLDLHGFQPKEIKELVPDYLEACQKRGILAVRIIHGKGSGTLRRIVHSALEKHPAVIRFQLGGHGKGSWGATTVDLHEFHE
jgi:DNA-nicking Smr family endonuclease